MIYNDDLRKLFEIMHLDPETIFKGGLGVYDQQQAENFMENIKTKAYDEGYDNGNIAYTDEIDEAVEEKEAEVKEDISNYVEYKLFDDYKKEAERQGRPIVKEDFDLIKELILENI